MGKLKDALNARMAVGDLGGHLERGTVPTGIDHFDYLNGRFDKDGNLSIGIGEGKIAYLAGWSGSGKSTIGIQMAWNIIKDDEDAQLFIYDCERSNSHMRVAQLAGLSYDEYRQNYEEDKVKLINSRTSTDNLTTLIREIYEVKMNTIGGVDFTKKGTSDKTNWNKVRSNIAEMPITIIMVDSWALLAPSKGDDSNEIRGNMAGAQIAKANNALIKQCCGTGWLYDANIMLLIINHISKAVNTDMYPPDARPIKWLKKDETLPGGGTAAYMADFMLRLDQVKGLKEDEELHVKGFLCGVTLCKSRSNASGHAITVVFDQYGGADNVLTNYLMLKAANKIGGSSTSYFLKGLDSVKFAQKNIRKMYTTNPAFQEHFDSLVNAELSVFIKQIEGKSSNVAEKIIEELPEVGLTYEDVMLMSVVELKRLCKDNQMAVDDDFWKGKLSQIRKDVADALFSEDEE
jgi:RecA/RadA recombinase